MAVRKLFERRIDGNKVAADQLAAMKQGLIDNQKALADSAQLQTDLREEFAGATFKVFSSPMYVNGVPVSAAWVDAADNAFVYFGTDGKAYFPTGLKGLAALDIAGLATLAQLLTTGTVTHQGDVNAQANLSVGKALTAALATLAGMTVEGSIKTWALADSQGNIAAEVLPDGSFMAYGQNSQVGPIGTQSTAGYATDVAWGIMGAAGGMPLYADSTGTIRIYRARIGTLLDGNGNPISFSSAPSGFRVDGTLVTSLKSLTAWGDSMTFGYKASSVTTKSYPAILAATLNDGRAVTNAGVVSQTSAHIAARAGAVPVTITVPSGSIPASGSVAVGIPSPEVGYNTTGLMVWLGGVYGRLDRTGAKDAPAYTFTRSVAGSAVACPGAVPLVPDAATHRENVTLIWVGRNDNPALATNLQATRDNIAAMVQRLRDTVALPRFLVFGLHLRPSETTATTNYTNILDHNAKLKALYMDRFVDPNLVSAVNADGTPYGGGNPLYFDADDLHYNDAGYQALGQYVATQFIQPKGW
ncbi:SGNH/GDSL hydrolase family protein [Deinococcus apachensis]|uniref:SGNH/GDSL hydrolase family protein n=1 Tax=Deinococcus apachensis TaxID=309886 RepID=UPI0003755843|nr:SGNH/GDSL hydrolase family protein [Deinococcus apachensis]